MSNPQKPNETPEDLATPNKEIEKWETEGGLILPDDSLSYPVFANLTLMFQKTKMVLKQWLRQQNTAKTK